jgi:hypothetical protein
MAFLGDFGRYFLGGSNTGDVSAATADFFGFEEGGQNIARNIGQGASDIISGTGSDVSTPPASAGIDSGATLSRVSQTGQLGRRQIDIDPRRGQGIGMNQAGFGAFAPLFTGAGRALTTSVGRNVALGVAGTAIGGALTMLDGSGRKLIITRKMQREVKEMFMFMGGDLNATANAYSNFKMRSYTPDNILAIMLKKFSSQGPFVTKAAVRKTRSTLRKMKTLADMTSDLMPRKAPVRRRAASTTTKLVRNG